MRTIIKYDVSGRPRKQFNALMFNIFINSKAPCEMMMKIFNMSRGTYFRYKKSLYVPLDLEQRGLNEELLKEQQHLFDDRVYNTVDNWAERIWNENEKEDFKQECLVQIWCQLGLISIKNTGGGIVALSNEICQEVFKKTIISLARKKKLIYIDDYEYTPSWWSSD